MKNITVSVDEETHRLARIRAAELDTSVSALVRGYLQGLAAIGSTAQASHGAETEAEYQLRQQRLDEVIARIREDSPGFRAADNLPREELYDRARARTEAQAAAGAKDKKRKVG